MAGEIVKYFDNLFIISQPKDCEEILEGIPKTVTDAI